jgi:hypothetical protein
MDRESALCLLQAWTATPRSTEASTLPPPRAAALHETHQRHGHQAFARLRLVYLVATYR